MLKIVVLLVMLPVMLVAQEPVKDRIATIQVDGDAIVYAKPDRAEIDLGVVTQSPDAKSAAAENAQKLDRVIQQLKQQIGQNIQVKTIGYSLSPNYVYPPQGGEPKITGYIASNTVQVQTDDLVQAGPIIDTAIKAGANNVQTIRFLLKEESAIQAQALQDAAKEARKKADALATSLGVRIVRVLHVLESGDRAIPLETRQFDVAAAKMEASTPVEPGMLEVKGRITLTLEIQ